jgi:hypothetical protein
LVMGPRLCKVQAAEKKLIARVVCPHVYSCKGNATMLSQVLVMSVETFAYVMAKLLERLAILTTAVPGKLEMQQGSTFDTDSFPGW